MTNLGNHLRPLPCFLAKVRNAAAMTYVAAALTAVVHLLYLLSLARRQ